MSCPKDDDLLESEVCLGEESCDMELGGEGVEGSSEEDGDERLLLEEYGMSVGKDGEVIESYDKREMITAMVVEDPLEPCEGMEFDSELAAREFYCSYARRVGFRLHVGKCRRSSFDGMVICRRFVCRNDGFLLPSSDCGIPAKLFPVPGLGCMARLVVKKQDGGKWFVTKFEREHSHALVSPRRVEIKSRDFKEIGSPDEGVDFSKEAVVPFQCQGVRTLEPFEGMEFQSDEAARTFYCEYGKDLGFTVRISKCRRGKDGTIIFRRFVCSKEGYYVRKYGRTKRSRALTRVGCLARFVVKKLDSGVWVVTNFEREHNHPPFVVGKEPPNDRPPSSTKGAHHCPLSTLEAFNGSISSRCEFGSAHAPNSAGWRFNKLREEGIKIANEGASSIESFNAAMLALREAMQKVISAKNCVRDSEVGILVSGCNQSSDGNKLMLVDSSSAQETSSKPSILEDTREGASQGGPLIAPQSLNLIPAAHKPQNGHVSKATVNNAVNVQNLQVSFDSITSHVVDSLSDQTSVRNKLANRNFTAVRKRSQNLGGSGVWHLEGSRLKNKAWNFISGAKSSACDNLVTPSDTHAAALHAVDKALNTPTARPPSSASPTEVSPVPTESSGSNNRSSNVLHRTPQHYRVPNPLVHAAAIAAGARIISPATVASLVKAEKSKEYLQSGEGHSIPKIPTRSSNSMSAIVGNANEPTQSLSGMHLRHTRDSSLPDVIPTHENGVLDSDAIVELDMTMDVQCDLLNLKAGEDWLMDQYEVDPAADMGNESQM